MLTLIPLPGIPLVQPGDDLAALLAAAMTRSSVSPRERDVLVVAQKVVSKSEGRQVDLATVRPSSRSIELAREVQKDARLVEVILSESRRIVRQRPGVLIVEHRLGFVMANAGVDRSNVARAGGAECVLLLPLDPDASASRLRQRLATHFGTEFAVVINDSFGRPWRRGAVGVALGTAGVPALLDLRGKPDLYGRSLEVTISGFADEIASAASLIMGEADEAVPAVVVRGLAWTAPQTPAASIVRPAEEDLFR